MRKLLLWIPPLLVLGVLAGVPRGKGVETEATPRATEVAPAWEPASPGPITPPSWPAELGRAEADLTALLRDVRRASLGPAPHVSAEAHLPHLLDLEGRGGPLLSEWRGAEAAAPSLEELAARGAAAAEVDAWCADLARRLAGEAAPETGAEVLTPLPWPAEELGAALNLLRARARLARHAEDEAEADAALALARRLLHAAEPRSMHDLLAFSRAFDRHLDQLARAAAESPSATRFTDELAALAWPEDWRTTLETTHDFLDSDTRWRLAVPEELDRAGHVETREALATARSLRQWLDEPEAELHRLRHDGALWRDDDPLGSALAAVVADGFARRRLVALALECRRTLDAAPTPAAGRDALREVIDAARRVLGPRLRARIGGEALTLELTRREGGAPAARADAEHWHLPIAR